MRNVLIGTVGAVALLAAFFGSSVTSNASFFYPHQENSVTIEVDVSVPPAPPTPGPGGSGAAQHQVAVNVGPPLTTFHMQLSTRHVTVAATPGKTVTSACGLGVNLINSSSYAMWLINVISQGDFEGYPSSFPEQGNLQFGAPNAAGTAYSYFAVPRWLNANSSLATYKTGHYNFSGCLPLKITVPKGTPAGKYYATLDVVYYNYNSATGSTPTPSPTPPFYPSVVLADGPSMYFHFDQPTSGTATDVSGNGHNANQDNNIVSVPGAIANWNDSAYLLANDVYLHGTYDPNVSAFTVEAWVKTSDNYLGDIYAGEEGNCPNIFDVRVSDGSNTYVPEGVPPGFVSVHIGQGPGSVNTPVVGILSTVAVNDGKWHYVVATWSAPVGSTVDPSQFQIYVDGNNVSGSQYSYGNLGLTAPILFNVAGGAATTPNCNGGYDYGWLAAGDSPGGFSIDELATYEYALTPAQVLRHYQVGAGLVTSAHPRLRGRRVR